jgi:methionyl-tRNA formyltransferase
MRLIFCGSPPFATPVFERLLRSRHRPLALVTAPDRPQGRGRVVEPSQLAVSARAANIAVLQPVDPHAIGADETAGELLAALAQLGGEAAVEALDLLESGRARFTPQDPSRATYARKLTKEHGAIDWTKSAAELVRFVRAMNPWPGATSVDSKQRAFTLLAAREAAASAAAEPGVVLEAQARFVVACGGGALELATLVPAGKRAMSGPEFLRGARIAVGERLGARKEA